MLFTIALTYLFQSSHIHFFDGWFGKKKKKKKKEWLIWSKKRLQQNFKSTVNNILIPVSIFAKARFVMWKNPSLMRRNTWYIPVNQKHTIQNSDSENLEYKFQISSCFQHALRIHF